jgi:UDP-N-acetylglucosamine acyltransferase
MSLIHPTAIIDPKAQVHDSVRVGPYTVIEEGVKVGPKTEIGPHCHLVSGTTLGEANRIHAGCVLGDSPQDLVYAGAKTGLTIGDRNIFREHVTVHRGTKEGTRTEIGNDSYFMAHAHVAHNCRIGNHVIVVNAVLLGGYVEVEDRAFLGGGAVVHQFCRIGTLSILRGLSRISKDVAPYCMVVENNEVVGLNTVGLKRAGFSLDQRTKLKHAYQTVFLSEKNTAQALEVLRSEKTSEVMHFVEFIQNSKRGICKARMKPTELGEESEEA